ncbi:hypothetical protein [Agromyces bauzanensis]|uniref:Uncharacterized protein n=1 Tax=Agromyces bauzanensis TaxID=1308924 RepID=A0A917UNJ8_9MICO|nr:hypothetical protein [Agromyces bauzanensis]GGJ70537.1 hypothetical protein GCM10011372_05550 [Agromyces bauzanensis]
MSAPDPNGPRGLGEQLKRAADAAAPNAIDVDEVLRRSRAARRSRRTALVSGVGAVAGVLAVTGLVFGLQGISGPTATDGQVALESADSGAASPESAGNGTLDDAAGSRLVAPHLVNRCGAPVVAPTDATSSPLAVTVAPPAGRVARGSAATVVITVTNTGDDVVSGKIAASIPVTIADDGVTVWHSGPGDDTPAIQVSIAPGTSMSLEAEFETKDCTEADEPGEPLPPDVPALEPGEYGLGAVVPFTDADGASTVYLVSPLAPFTVG